MMKNQHRVFAMKRNFLYQDGGLYTKVNDLFQILNSSILFDSKKRPTSWDRLSSIWCVFLRVSSAWSVFGSSVGEQGSCVSVLSCDGTCGTKESDRIVTVAGAANVASAGAGPHWHYNVSYIKLNRCKYRTSCIKEMTSNTLKSSHTPFYMIVF